MEIPKSATYITGEQDKGYSQIDNFFDSVIKEHIRLPKNHPNIERRVRGMWRLDNEVRTDEHVHLLLYEQRVVAVVIETKTDNNYVHLDFLREK